jgi:hypothetical protein
MSLVCSGDRAIQKLSGEKVKRFRERSRGGGGEREDSKTGTEEKKNIFQAELPDFTAKFLLSCALLAMNMNRVFQKSLPMFVRSYIGNA